MKYFLLYAVSYIIGYFSGARWNGDIKMLFGIVFVMCTVEFAMFLLLKLFINPFVTNMKMKKARQKEINKKFKNNRGTITQYYGMDSKKKI